MSDKERIDNLTKVIEERIRKQLGLPPGAELPPMYLSRFEPAELIPAELPEAVLRITYLNPLYEYEEEVESE